MRASRALLSAAAVVLVIGVVVPQVAPEESKPKPKPKPQPQKIALLDITQVFKNNFQAKAAKEKLQRDVARAEAEVAKEKEEIKAMQTMLEGFKKGSRDYEDSEKQMAERVAALNVRIAMQRKQFMQQEAKDYYKTYQAVDKEVRRYAKENQITMVFKHDSGPGDPADPDSVIRVLNRSVVYWEDGMDITPVIVERVNENAE